MKSKDWAKDKRMGVTFENAMRKFECVKFENGVYYSTPECEKIIDEYFGANTFEEAVIKCEDYTEYDIKGLYGYTISRTPYELYMKKHPKLEENFDRIRDIIVKHFNSQCCDDKILGQLHKSKNIKEWNFKTCYNMFGKIPEKITIYRGIKNDFDPNYYENKDKYTCWTSNIEQGERFAKFYFTGGYQFKPSYTKNPTLLVAEVKPEDVAVFIGSDESEIIMKGDVELKDVVKLKQEINESKSNIKSFDYQAVTKNEKGEPVLYVVDYIIVKNDVDKIECKIKGYQYTDIDIDGETKKGWIKVNDFNSNRTHLIDKKDFKNGSDKRKIYDIMI
ncbi:MAG: hypothetical protein HPY57_13610 [Ignavibacteria bacterium]|nr:hypothetical protein [Ignavibacteria bacterium]